MSESILDTPPEDTPEGNALRWSAEFGAARNKLREWQERGDKIVKRYLDEREHQGSQRLCLFTSNVQTMEALIFGKTPEVEADRRFADSQDDVARVGAEILERLLNTDIEKDTDTQQEAFRNALSDRLRPGLGVVRCVYKVEFDQVEETPATDKAPAIPASEAKRPGSEVVDVDYVPWRDNLWSPCRVFSELRWWAFCNQMPRKAFKKRFPGGEFKANKTPADGKTKDPLARCDVWEIWDKDERKVYWYVEGQSATLDEKDDPLGLDGFWPFPRPMVANPTTRGLIPTPDFTLAQDLYDGIDTLYARICALEDACNVRGAYDKTSPEVGKLLKGAGNFMVPVENWAAFGEKGGVDGAVSWLPIDMIAKVIEVLTAKLQEKIALLFQVTGMSDIMRGQASEQTTATEQAIKARFASVRVQTLQDEFARFCSDVQRIKAEIIAKHFDPETIIERSNIMATPDAALVPQAVQLIKSKLSDYRIKVNPDSVSLTDFAALKQERFEFMQSIAGFFQGVVLPAAQIVPASVPYLLQLSQEACAGLKGSSTMEGIFDQMIAAAKQAAANPPPPQPDPKLEAAKVKAGAETTKAQTDIAKTGLDFQVAKAKHGMEMQKLAVEQRAAGLDHVRGIQSEEAKQRTIALQGVNRVTEPGRD